MKRIAIVAALAGSALFGSVVTASALGGPSTEGEWRSRITDCAIAHEAAILGVPRSAIPETTLRCQRLVRLTLRFR